MWFLLWANEHYIRKRLESIILEIQIYRIIRICIKLGELYKNWINMNFTYLVSVLAFAIQHPVLAELSPELVQVWR